MSNLCSYKDTRNNPSTSKQTIIIHQVLCLLYCFALWETANR